MDPNTSAVRIDRGTTYCGHMLKYDDEKQKEWIDSRCGFESYFFNITLTTKDSNINRKLQEAKIKLFPDKYNEVIA